MEKQKNRFCITWKFIIYLAVFICLAAFSKKLFDSYGEMYDLFEKYLIEQNGYAYQEQVEDQILSYLGYDYFRKYRVWRYYTAVFSVLAAWNTIGEYLGGVRGCYLEKGYFKMFSLFAMILFVLAYFNYCDDNMFWLYLFGFCTLIFSFLALGSLYDAFIHLHFPKKYGSKANKKQTQNSQPSTHALSKKGQ